MRIIAGQFRGRVIKSPPNLKTRPTSDRLRESLFNIINPRINERTIFLDLCAGTGAIGIEAISRGVSQVTFVEISRKVCGLIEENLDNLAIPESQTEIICEKAEKFLVKTSKTFDIVYFDPPYQNDYAQILQQFGEANSKLLTENGIFIAEHSSKENLPDLVGELRRWRILKQGDSSLSFYELK
ncbi:MAG: 16S rRNA (guanine(966)-N(2))-methyltransferase RsmD [Pyrinomonadaceae bacterium]|nr:16S rRNA (guanine(966)-N(2))-methyltransferase RsmD [Pyrinomonadaceae bacterium]